MKRAYKHLKIIIHMKAIIVVISIATALLSSSVVYGQRVERKNGIFIVDLSGMIKEGSTVTKTGKKSTTTADSTSLGYDEENDLSSKKNNETLYYKFEIIDVKDWRRWGWSKGMTATYGEGATWKQAIDACSKFEIDGRKNWRLPTQGEAVLLSVLWIPIRTVGCSVLNMEGVGYNPQDISQFSWTATEYNADYAWWADYVSGETYPKVPGGWSSYNKKKKLKFFCIREIHEPEN